MLYNSWSHYQRPNWWENGNGDESVWLEDLHGRKYHESDGSQESGQRCPLLP